MLYQTDLYESGMNKLLMLFLGLAFNNSAHCENDIQRGAGAVAGIFAGIYVHEAGHGLAFYAAGAEDIKIRVPGTQCALLCGQTDAKWVGPSNPAAARAINAAGFIASNLTAELLVRHESAAKSAFGQGIIATNLYSNVAHVVTYYTKVRGRDGYGGNDIDAYEIAGGNPHFLSAALIAYSAYALQRMHKKKIPVLFVQLRF